MQHSSTIAMSAKTARYLLLGRLGFFGLWLLQPLWILWLAPPQLGNAYTLLTLLWLPLWFPLYGMIKGHAYTLAWANFIVMIYFLHSLTNLWVSTGMHQLLSVTELLLASMMFIGCTYYARFRGQELGLKIPKLKDDPRR
ncbi:DUF2069 domain-containing protein [Rheinheimera sp. YQF-2]|uniref:DUF2069 domain-containing protein n=1 Tax=Rheinheimera lutimaris TaxID=2740584 RepID=A0A7Y5AT45_9GAMM|nr:DUF2069 domain-containing protein [Rheinheimera lutimaris]NRQ44077.1 DUF2069 domain-containing protein [Rheinheimera lutimaris]